MLPKVSKPKVSLVANTKSNFIVLYPNIDASLLCSVFCNATWLLHSHEDHAVSKLYGCRHGWWAQGIWPKGRPSSDCSRCRRCGCWCFHHQCHVRSTSAVLQKGVSKEQTCQGGKTSVLNTQVYVTSLQFAICNLLSSVEFADSRKQSTP